MALTCSCNVFASFMIDWCACWNSFSVFCFVLSSLNSWYNIHLNTYILLCLCHWTLKVTFILMLKKSFPKWHLIFFFITNYLQITTFTQKPTQCIQSIQNSISTLLVMFYVSNYKLRLLYSILWVTAYYISYTGYCKHTKIKIYTVLSLCTEKNVWSFMDKEKIK